MNREQFLYKLSTLKIFKVYSNKINQSKISLARLNYHNELIDKNDKNYSLFLISLYYEAVSVVALKNNLYDEKKQKKLINFQNYAKKVVNFIYDCFEQNSNIFSKFHSLIKTAGALINLDIDKQNFEQNINKLTDELIKSVLELSKYFAFNDEISKNIESKYINLLNDIKGKNKTWVPNLCFALCEYKNNYYYYAVSGIDNEQNYFKLDQGKNIIHKEYYDLICSFIEELLGFDKSILKLDKCVLTKQSLLYTTDYCKENDGEVFLLPHPITLEFLIDSIGYKKISSRKFSCAERKIVDNLLKKCTKDVVLNGFNSKIKVNILGNAKFYVRFKPCNFCKPALFGCNFIYFLDSKTFCIKNASINFNSASVSFTFNLNTDLGKI